MIQSIAKKNFFVGHYFFLPSFLIHILHVFPCHLSIQVWCYRRKMKYESKWPLWHSGGRKRPLSKVNPFHLPGRQSHWCDKDRRGVFHGWCTRSSPTVRNHNTASTVKKSPKTVTAAHRIDLKNILSKFNIPNPDSNSLFHHNWTPDLSGKKSSYWMGIRSSFTDESSPSVFQIHHATLENFGKYYEGSAARLTRFEGRGYKKFPKGPPFAYVFWKNFQRVPPLLTFFGKISKGSPLCFRFSKKFSKKMIKGGGEYWPFLPPRFDRRNTFIFKVFSFRFRWKFRVKSSERTGFLLKEWSSIGTTRWKSWKTPLNGVKMYQEVHGSSL